MRVPIDLELHRYPSLEAVEASKLLRKRLEPIPHRYIV
jgi:hypothetical protein